MRGLVKYVIAVGLAGVGTASAVAAAAPQVGAVFTAHDSTSSLPDLSTLAERSVMYDINGTQIQIFTAAENRKPVNIADVPRGVIDAVLAVEDEAFYIHKGVNVRSLVRATLANVSAGGVVQGGSTISQQVVKMGLVGSKRDADRKIREAMYALRLEKLLTKDEILERYLNSVYFGNGAYGVKAAAEVFFGKLDVAELTIADGAFLAGLIRNPNGYDPFRYPQRFLTRREFVLDRLVSLDKLTRTEADAIAATKPPIRSFATPERQPAPTYFVARARQALLNDPTILGETDQERYTALFTGGLRIYTTFDPHLQQLAEQARTELMPDTGGQFEAALASVDPTTGAVKALVGGPGFDVLNFDLSTQGRNQAGSAFKTFVLTAALEGGARPTDLIDGNAGCVFPIQGQEPYSPAGHGAGVGQIDRMFSSSINCAFVRMGLAVTPERVVETAERMGIPTGVLQPFASISLGTFGVSPLNMASAYATLAAEGVRHDPYYIERIEDRHGNVIYQHEPRGTQVVDRNVALTATKVMQGVITGGTGRKAAIKERPTAGKTGTTNDSTDVWFVGFTPELSTAVWIGSRYGDTETVKLNGKVQFGGDLPAQIWQRFMSTALEGRPPTPFSEPQADARQRPTARIILPGDECWAKDISIPTADTSVVTLAPDLKWSNKPPPTLAPTSPDPRLAPIPLVPVTGFSVRKCAVVAAEQNAARDLALTSVSEAPTTVPPPTSPVDPVTTVSPSLPAPETSTSTSTSTSSTSSISTPGSAP